MTSGRSCRTRKTTRVHNQRNPTSKTRAKKLFGVNTSAARKKIKKPKV